MSDVHVLVVDDDEDMRVLVRMVIERACDSLEVVAEAANGHAALSASRSLRPDVVVTDQRMPGMTGIELAAHLRGETDVPVILYSAFADDALRALADEAGVCTVLEKDRYREIPAAIWACLDRSA